MRISQRLQQAAQQIKRDVLTVYFAARDSRTPVLVRLLALAVAAYALSPIDLIPDFIPVLGYLDDLILLPLGILLVIKFTPAEVLNSSRAMAQQMVDQPSSPVAAAVIVLLWVLCATALLYWLITGVGE
ncbi:YkvA family protein [Rheinheimera sp. 4Y26]|uniref:YkvA family protein n=1 Tax=Rheinheimera sp. 4Y26 TaxID=2977811 RepID=UPI0021B13547|nr:DUF1232 domain-containing protein [Rheinheimera sp. 4Y26]MCT6699783.1 DUF1232 domain-containing protein [Rheinheimera sp. 4Y26]